MLQQGGWGLFPLRQDFVSVSGHVCVCVRCLIVCVCPICGAARAVSLQNRV